MKTQRSIDFDTGGIRYVFDPCGHISRFISPGSVLLNSMIPGPADGGIGEIVLRIYEKDRCTAYPLTGRDACCDIRVSDDGICYESRCGSILAQVCFIPAPDGWLWHTGLTGCCEAFDLIYMQDIGLAEISAQRTNELYTAQYLAHHVHTGPHGYVIASRQNLPQNGRHPCLWQGMLDGSAVSYATDGSQYFGTGYKTSGVPAARDKGLPGTILQGESACIALQTEKTPLKGNQICTFFALYQEDHGDTISASETPDTAALSGCLSRTEQLKQAPVYEHAHPREIKLYTSPEATEEEVCSLYPVRELEERTPEGKLLSFFLPDHRHIVLQKKELLCTRPHGTILTTLFDPEKLPDNLLTTTAYMYGNLACQTVIGNTSFHKLNSVSRGLYDWLPFSGTRLLIRLNGCWYRLGLPSLFEMDFHAAMWRYNLPDDILIVRVYTGAEAPGMKLEVQSTHAKTYDFILTMQAVMGNMEFDQPAQIQRRGNAVLFRMSENVLCRYPDLYYSLQPDCPFDIHRDDPLTEDSGLYSASLVTLSFDRRSGFTIQISGDLYGKENPPIRSCRMEKEAFHAAYRDFLQDFSVQLPSDPVTGQRIDHTAYWFLHNAMVHFCVPHGLEQSGGAAWGTRDVCQGPFELFMATRHYTLARNVLVRLFENQAPDGDWPQWFMFDRYHDIRAGDSHGDIVIWPLKALGDYLTATGNESLLSERIQSSVAHEARTVKELVMRSLSLLESRFIPGTDLLQYGGGDWDDTLQPARSEYRQKMSSVWTQALAYQALKPFCALSTEIGSDIAASCKKLCARLKKGFGLMTADGFVPGFCITGKSDQIRYMIYPGDHETGIGYRLIPYTRAILSGLADKESAESYLELIRSHLLAPDGVHLLDRPTHYTGGNSSLFVRAEQAVNIGREISLQYVHAHIRYASALASLGHGSQAWQALLQVTPPLLSLSVPNAQYRQSNMYFSSSDADLPDRSAFEAGYSDVLEGHVPVRGGWRLYSSGPGIFLSLLLDSLLAVHGGNPLIPAEYDGLTVTVRQNGITRVMRYDARTGRYVPVS